MDDDLWVLDTLPTRPAPSAETVDHGRRQLENEIRASLHPRTAVGRRRRSGWLTAGLGLTAVTAAATAAVVAIGSVAPTTGAGSKPQAAEHRPAVTRMSGKQILLAAAASAAAAASTGSGRFWYVKTIDTSPIEDTRDVYETWTSRDGQIWARKSAHSPVRKYRYASGFWPGSGFTATLKQIQRLPGRPGALKAWVARWMTDHVNRADAAAGKPGKLSPGRADDVILGPMTDLLWDVPVSPQVRAAAFRVLASLPGVKNLGLVPGGKLVRITYPGYPAGAAEDLVVAPATARVARIIFHSVVSHGRKLVPVIKGELTVLTSHWTNQLPK